MGVFGFIENFFFISLALVFVLVLLLVYHFKNRITIAEKKSESMYGLLTAVVKEIKSLRGMFGMVNEQFPSPPSNFEVKSKSEPEVNIFHGSEQLPNAQKEVITLDFSASDNKIVVSDDSDDDLSDDSDSEIESESSDSDSEEEEEEYNGIDLDLDITQEQVLSTMDILDVESVHANVKEDLVLEEIDVSFDIVENVQPHAETVLLANNSQPDDAEEVVQEPEALEDKKELQEQSATPIPTIDQLRKMNINQLKTVAYQINIASDITKLKKPELILLIQSASSH
jgi:hypothetical protein